MPDIATDVGGGKLAPAAITVKNITAPGVTVTLAVDEPLVSELPESKFVTTKVMSVTGGAHSLVDSAGLSQQVALLQ